MCNEKGKMGTLMVLSDLCYQSRVISDDITR